MRWLTEAEIGHGSLDRGAGVLMGEALSESGRRGRAGDRSELGLLREAELSELEPLGKVLDHLLHPVEDPVCHGVVGRQLLLAFLAPRRL